MIVAISILKALVPYCSVYQYLHILSFKYLKLYIIFKGQLKSSAPFCSFYLEKFDNLLIGNSGKNLNKNLKPLTFFQLYNFGIRFALQ